MELNSFCSLYNLRRALSDSLLEPRLQIVHGKPNHSTVDCALCLCFKLAVNARMVRRFSPAHHVPTCSRDCGGGRTQLSSAFASDQGSSLWAWRGKWSLKKWSFLARQDFWKCWLELFFQSLETDEANVSMRYQPIDAALKCSLVGEARLDRRCCGV